MYCYLFPHAVKGDKEIIVSRNGHPSHAAAVKKAVKIQFSLSSQHSTQCSLHHRTRTRVYLFY